MSVIGRALMSLAAVIGLAISIYKIVILAAVIMTWVRPDPNHPLVKFVNQVTEPVFSWVRSRLPQSLLSTGIDLSPIIVFFVLIFIESFVVGSLSDMGHSLVFDPSPSDQVLIYK